MHHIPYFLYPAPQTLARGVPQGRATVDERVRLRGIHVQVRRLHRHGEVEVKCTKYTSQSAQDKGFGAQGTGMSARGTVFGAWGTGYRVQKLLQITLSGWA